MSKLISFGDSFAWGSDMQDTFQFDEVKKYLKANPDKKYCDLYSRHTWQAKMAEHLGLEYCCLAREGCSNNAIYRRFFESVDLFTPDDIIVVNFTWRTRTDFFDSEDDKWRTIRPSGTEDLLQTPLYFKYFQSNVQDQFEALKIINGVVSYLELHNHKYIITVIDSLIFDDPHHDKPVTKELQKQVADKITWFDGVSFFDWCKQNNYPISEYWHPLEDSHTKAFEYLKANGVVDKYAHNLKGN